MKIASLCITRDTQQIYQFADRLLVTLKKVNRLIVLRETIRRTQDKRILKDKFFIKDIIDTYNWITRQCIILYLEEILQSGNIRILVVYLRNQKGEPISFPPQAEIIGLPIESIQIRLPRVARNFDINPLYLKLRLRAFFRKFLR